MKERSTQHSVDEVRTVIKKCLEEAALVNYTRISEFAKIEGTVQLCKRVFNLSFGWHNYYFGPR